jgi:ribonuclease VapC
MYLDASAIVAILAQEDDAALHALKIELAQTPFFISPATLYEAVLSLAAIAAKHTRTPVTADRIERAQATVAEFVRSVGAEEIAISPEIGHKAIDAAKLYGKSVGHPARLNLGDCFAYACAKVQRVQLLYKGNDFSETDLA